MLGLLAGKATISGLYHDHHDEGVVGADQILSADLIFHSRTALPLFTDLFGVCERRDPETRSMARIFAGIGACVALSSVGRGWIRSSA
jgi:hypothetical protein